MKFHLYQMPCCFLALLFSNKRELKRRCRGCLRIYSSALLQVAGPRLLRKRCTETLPL
jgi:hypothetical protein